jgi:hypothetical protein
VTATLRGYPVTLRTIETAADLTPDPYEHVMCRGKLMDQASAGFVLELEEILGYRLTIVQGIGGAPTSAGTHLEGRALDLASYDGKRKVRKAKQLGACAYYRPTIRGLWNAHCHLIIPLNRWDNTKGLAPAGFRQIASYREHRDGLAYNGWDPTGRPTPERLYKYPNRKVPKPVPPTNVTRARDKIVEAAHTLGEAAVLLEQTPSNRRVARAGAVTARGIAASARALLRAIPNR